MLNCGIGDIRASATPIRRALARERLRKMSKLRDALRAAARREARKVEAAATSATENAFNKNLNIGE